MIYKYSILKDVCASLTLGTCNAKIDIKTWVWSAILCFLLKWLCNLETSLQYKNRYTGLHVVLTAQYMQCMVLFNVQPTEMNLYINTEVRTVAH